MKKGLFLLVLCQPVFAENYKIHILKEGETLSEILWNHGYKPLYGENNWVDKTLKMNHLQTVQDKEIKKGFPIILPSKEDPSRPATVTKYKTIKEVKYVNRNNRYISKHQEVFLKSGITSLNGEVKSNNVDYSETINVGFLVEGKNDYRIGSLIYNFDGELNYKNSSTAKYNYESDLKLKPTYGLRTSMRLNKSTLPFEFGFSYKVEEESIVDFDEKVNARRDQNHWVGFRLNKKNINVFGNLLDYEGIYEKNFIQNSLSNDKRYEASRFSFKVRDNITDSLFTEAILNWTNYTGTEVSQTDSFAFNLIYKIQ